MDSGSEHMESRLHFLHRAKYKTEWLRQASSNQAHIRTPQQGGHGSIQSLSCVWLFVTPWTAARQASLSITNSQSLLKPKSIELVMPSNHLILGHPFLLPSIFPSIRVFTLAGKDSQPHKNFGHYSMHSVQFSSVAQLCPTLCDPIQPSHPLLSPSPPALNLSQQQGLFQ